MEGMKVRESWHDKRIQEDREVEKNRTITWPLARRGKYEKSSRELQQDGLSSGLVSPKYTRGSEGKDDRQWGEERGAADENMWWRNVQPEKNEGD